VHRGLVRQRSRCVPTVVVEFYAIPITRLSTVGYAFDHQFLVDLRCSNQTSDGCAETLRSLSTTAQRYTSILALVAGPIVLQVLSGCTSIGPGLVPQDRVGYADAMADSWKDQLLLNIVRLRYGDAPTFMDVSSVVSSYALQGQVQANVIGNLGVPKKTTTLPDAIGSAGLLGSYSDRPTISYTPLTGKKFAQSLLTPIPPSAIFSLISAGYAADFVLPTTVRAFNGIYNSTFQSGSRRPADPEFYPLIAAMQRLQLSRAISIQVKKRGPTETVIAVLGNRNSPQVKQDVEFIQQTLKLKSREGEIILSYGPVQQQSNELAVLSRSMIEIMVEMSADIEVPVAHVQNGRTYANTSYALGNKNAASPKIYSGASAPADAFAKIRYRDAWYWIADTDFYSKRSLTLMLLFFSLAETGVVPAAPLLTIPVQ
jgi:hypothetical protein